MLAGGSLERKLEAASGPSLAVSESPRNRLQEILPGSRYERTGSAFFEQMLPTTIF